MKVLRLLLPILLTMLAIACKNEPKQAAATAAPAQVDQMAQKVAYLCPMDCEKGKTYDQPGQCPVCKMDLEAATADQLRHAATEVATAEESTELAADDPNKSLETELNTLHDQTMKEMADMERIGRQLKAEFKAEQNPEIRKQYVKAIADISRSGMEMMSWMRSYRAPRDLPAAEATRYLNEQKTKMQRNREAIRAATAEGKGLVK